jgi:hypothetical protein
VPLAIVTWQYRRSWRTMLAAAALGATVIAGAYGGAAIASRGVAAFRDSVREQARYVRAVDSFRNPERAPLPAAAKVVFVNTLRPAWLAAAIFALAALALLIGDRRATLLVLATFLPFAVTVWLNLNLTIAARYAVGFMPAYAMLAAAGIEALSRRRIVLQAMASALLVTLSAAAAFPAMRTLHATKSPPASAFEWIGRNAPGADVYVSSTVRPQAEYLLPRNRVSYFDRTEQIDRTSEPWIISPEIVEGGLNFRRPHGLLWELMRQQNFEASVSRTTSAVRFGPGWYDWEVAEGGERWRWMSGDATVVLQPTRASGTLYLRLNVPHELTTPPVVEIYFNDRLIERAHVTNHTIERRYRLPSRPDSNTLRLRTSNTVNLAQLGLSGDSRDLGLQLDALSWAGAGVTPEWERAVTR